MKQILRDFVGYLSCDWNCPDIHDSVIEEYIRETYSAVNENKKVNDLISDLVANFLYYDRKEDEEMPVGKLQDLIKSDKLTVEDITYIFNQELKKQLKTKV